MAKSNEVKPTVKNYNYSLFRSDKKYSIVEDNAIGEIVPGVVIKKSNGSIQTKSTFNASGLIVVNYTVPYIGDDQSKAFLTGVNEFYNAVVGSALQTTDISVADLAAYIVLTHEWRAAIKDIDRVLTCYNQTTLLNPAYGSQLINGMTGNSNGYAFVRSNSAQLVEMRNLLAEKVNTKFPVVKGSLLGAYDDMMLDNVYCDDPDAKSAIIVAHRDMFHLQVQSNPLVKLIGTDFWDTLIAMWSDNQDFTEYLSETIDSVTQDSWYTDVRPYVENLIRRGGLQTDAGIKQFDASVINKPWAPVYSTDLINLIKCSTIVARNPNIPASNSWFYEDDRGLFKYNNMFTCFAADSEASSEGEWFYNGQVVNAAGKIVNLHSYPYEQRELDLAIVGTPDISALESEGSDTQGVGEIKIKLHACCGGVITKIVYISAVNPSTQIVSVVSNLLLVVTNINAHYFLSDQEFGIITQGDLMFLQQFNALPFIMYGTVIDEAVESEGYIDLWLHDTVAYFNVVHDIDNLVELPSATLKAAYHRFAYEAVYEGGSAKVVNPTK